jgi:hypothetical protein
MHILTGITKSVSSLRVRLNIRTATVFITTFEMSFTSQVLLKTFVLLELLLVCCVTLAVFVSCMLALDFTFIVISMLDMITDIEFISP